MSAGNAGIFMPFVLALGYATLLILLLGVAGQIYKKFKKISFFLNYTVFKFNVLTIHFLKSFMIR